ncbi:unnamed protein product [Phaedon cochleariae]|uniref:DUF4455 domain-containing protein n=1 Tax=Phaedon cochleariae TaxID=80249 RepID=A0A9P0DGU0_PHACE|nr:unnamed protein product [Phaedon cochleariae]
MCDDFDIRTLPSNFVSVSRPSEVIEKLNERRKKAHEDAIKSMRERQRKLNLEADEAIKNESDIFNRNFGELKEEVDLLVRTVKFEYIKMHDNLIHGQDLVNKPFLKVSDSYEILLKTVDEFHEKLVDVDKKRSEILKLIMNETRNTVFSSAYFLPYQVDKFFYEEILELNKITLNNCQNFAELKRDLKLQVSRYMRFWSEELLEIKERQKFYVKQLSKKSVDRLKSDLRSQLATVCQSDEVADALHKLETQQNDLQWPNDGASGIPVSQKEVELWLKDVQKTLASLDLNARNLVSLYKSIIIILFNRFFGELAKLKDSMAKSGLMDKQDIEDYQSEIYTPTVEELNVQFESDFENLQSIWNEKIDQMKDSVYTTYRFLKGSASLWDRHFKRVIDLQTCVLLDLENTVSKNSQTSMVHEAGLNIQIEKLRQGADEKKLDHFLGDVQGILDKIENLYKVSSDLEIQVVQKYKNMMEIEIEVLMAEIQRFLTLHPPDAERDPKIQRKRASQCSEKEIDPKELLVPNQILYCTFQVDATKNWMFGLWEAINHYLSTGRAEILAVTENWMERQREKINDRLQVKLAFHKPRYFRIKCSIYDKRLKELWKHAERFTSHKTAAEREILLLKNTELTIEEQFSKTCNQFILETNSMLQKAETFQKSYQLRGSLQTLAPLLTSRKKALTELQRNYFDKCMNLLDTLRASSYQFLKSTKLFSEEGSFSIEEITNLQKHMSKLDEYAEKTLNKYTNDAQTKFTKYIGYLDSTYASTLSTFEELIRELDHNENVVKKMKKLRENIRTEVISVKTTLKKIETDAKSLTQKCTQDVGSIEKLDWFIENYQKIIEKMQDFVSFMGQPNLSPRTFVSAATSISGHTTRMGRSKSHADHDMFLTISQMNTEENTFLYKLNMILDESYMDIKKQSKDFYGKHHPLLLDQFKIQPNHERCMEEVHHKYKIFQQQCEACWYENLNEFSSILNEFQYSTNHYLKAFEKTFRRCSIDRCEETNRNILNELENTEKETQNSFLNMFKRLRTLYGHPSNKTLLEELQKEFEDLEQNFSNIEDILIPHKEDLLTVYNEEVENFKRVQERISILKEDDRLRNLIQDLECRLSDEQSQSCHLLESGSVNDIREEHRSHITYRASAKVPMSTVNYYSPTESTTSSENSEESPKQFLEELDRTYEKNIQGAAEFVEIRLVEYLRERKNIWTSETNSIRDLFKVKYDDKNIL